MKRNSVAMKGNHFDAIFGSMLPRVMLSRMRPKAPSITTCRRPEGRAAMRRAA